MKRPSLQLVFLALLRRASALAAATEPRIQLRLARRTDVPSIARCNLASLPENYNSQFYMDQLRQWPDLAIVAEQIVEVDEAELRRRQLPYNNPFFTVNHHHQRLQQQPVQSNIVAYVLGKVTNGVPNSALDSSPLNQANRIGHVTSLAVMGEHRRKGLAAAMMKSLHQQMYYRNVPTVGLHVRISNRAACALYEKDGYKVEEVIPSYYHDGEDAFFMKKALDSSVATSPLFEIPSADRRPDNDFDANTPELLTGTL